MNWVILVNRKLSTAEVYGPYDDYYVATTVERQLRTEGWVKTSEVKEVKELRTDDDGHLVRTAYL